MPKKYKITYTECTIIEADSKEEAREKYSSEDIEPTVEILQLELIEEDKEN